MFSGFHRSYKNVETEKSKPANKECFWLKKFLRIPTDSVKTQSDKSDVLLLERLKDSGCLGEKYKIQLFCKTSVAFAATLIEELITAIECASDTQDFAKLR